MIYYWLGLLKKKQTWISKNFPRKDWPTIIATLPAGDSKEEAGKKKVKLEYKKFLLENRKESYGVVALLEKELDLTKVTLALAEIDAFTAAITTRKAAL